VGYSTHSNKGWDVKAFQAAQAEKDRQIELVLERILQELKKLHTAQVAAGCNNLPDLLVSGKMQSINKMGGRGGRGGGMKDCQIELDLERILHELNKLHMSRVAAGCNNLPDLLVSGKMQSINKMGGRGGRGRGMKDRQIELVLERILHKLNKLHTAQVAAGCNNLPDLLVSGKM
jgi:hypothetical protein